MMRILILGGYGLTGRLLARHLFEQSEAEIVLAGRHLEKAQALADQLEEGRVERRVTARQIDAASKSSLEAGLREVDLLLVAAPTTEHSETVIRAALNAGVDYLDIQLSSKKLKLLRSLAPEIEKAGCCFVTEAGFHPGLPAALVRHAASRKPGLSTATIGCYLNLGHHLAYTEAVDELMSVFRDYEGQVFEKGAWAPPGSYRVREIDFGSDIGRRRAYSMFFEELRDLPATIPSLEELAFFMAGSHWFVDWIITPVIMLGLKLAPGRGLRPLGKLLCWSMSRFNTPPYRVVLRIEASDDEGPAGAAYTAELSHEDAYELTAIPVVASLLQYLDGTLRQPGLWLMGQSVQTERFMRDMQRMGVSISESGASRAKGRPEDRPLAHRLLS